MNQEKDSGIHLNRNVQMKNVLRNVCFLWIGVFCPLYKLCRLAAPSASVYRHFVLVCDTRAAGESGRRLWWFTQVVSSGHSASSALSSGV